MICPLDSSFTICRQALVDRSRPRCVNDAVWQDLVDLYVRAVRNGSTPSTQVVQRGNGSDLSKMTPQQKRQEMVKRRTEAQKEKV